jgi:hypothetical protein
MDGWREGLWGFNTRRLPHTSTTSASSPLPPAHSAATSPPKYHPTPTPKLVDVILKPGLQEGAVSVFLDFISYSGGPLPEELLEQVGLVMHAMSHPSLSCCCSAAGGRIHDPHTVPCPAPSAGSADLVADSYS